MAYTLGRIWRILSLKIPNLAKFFLVFLVADLLGDKTLNIHESCKEGPRLFLPLGG